MEPAESTTTNTTTSTTSNCSSSSSSTQPQEGEIQPLVVARTQSVEARQLSEAEAAMVAATKMTVSEYHKSRFDTHARMFWDKFYHANKTFFFKDRHWLYREFPPLVEQEPVHTLLEIGCGVGNAFFPLLQANPTIEVYACDFAKKAVDLITQNELYKANASRCHAFVCDVINTPISDTVPANKVDLCTCLFVLSAMVQSKMPAAVSNIFNALKPGATLFFRDYGINDEAMLRFAKQRNSKLDENLYVRQDGTQAFFFTLEHVQELFQSAGFEQLSSVYVFTETINRKEELQVPRVFVQSLFRKPDTSAPSSS
ncbi:methyltransferase-like protein 6 [Capsaspora owczarzaki ATCC 30864]|uniref:tRNA N(3)-methylcytidine methyltransferase n=1 Tax=Capsaspora owczarzaki (strain ATCC 30864) TaxID=595528 RepID=A0A0D2WVV5_CAPO3|nr:methyltransferase-like protein 6 [Capsaspora owczarzaki ATCC 30864]KJE96458.1 methyltransferase-like protein 6 [Capsaspora owczarzaki ATCC 30864]|eukprot:XP_004344405.1 methyltransferase-like protein 6 [Capsaspora owczarzaki ATCC 30864]